MIPLGIITGLKWAGGIAILLTIAYGLNAAKNYHLDQIDKAVLAAQSAFALEQDELLRNREVELREEARAEKLKIEQELKVERAKVTDLRRMLLIDHDLDRLLQRKPGLILIRVNKGTQEYFEELEKITQ
jgi:hypothetical protein